MKKPPEVNGGSPLGSSKSTPSSRHAKSPGSPVGHTCDQVPGGRPANVPEVMWSVRNMDCEFPVLTLVSVIFEKTSKKELKVPPPVGPAVCDSISTTPMDGVRLSRLTKTSKSPVRPNGVPSIGDAVPRDSATISATIRPDSSPWRPVWRCTTVSVERSTPPSGLDTSGTEPGEPHVAIPFQDRVTLCWPSAGTVLPVTSQGGVAPPRPGPTSVRDRTNAESNDDGRPMFFARRRRGRESAAPLRGYRASPTRKPCAAQEVDRAALQLG